METTYRSIVDAEAREAKERERLRYLQIAERELGYAEAALKSIESALASPDAGAETLIKIASLIDGIDAGFSTRAITIEGNGLSGGQQIICPGGQNLRTLLRTLVGDAIARTNGLRSSLEQKLPAARLRVKRARAGVKKFEKRVEDVRGEGSVTLPAITAEATGAAR